jgi:hypothetical protein
VTQQSADPVEESISSGSPDFYWRGTTLLDRRTHEPVAHIHDKRWTVVCGGKELHGLPEPIARTTAVHLAAAQFHTRRK